MMESFETLLHSERPVLVHFFATWCEPCQIFGPLLKDIKDTLGERIAIAEIDVDKNKDVSRHYRIKNVPSLVLFQNGIPIWRQSGVLSRHEIVNAILDKTTWPELPNKPL